MSAGFGSSKDANEKKWQEMTGVPLRNWKRGQRELLRKVVGEDLYNIKKCRGEMEMSGNYLLLLHDRQHQHKQAPGQR